MKHISPKTMWSWAKDLLNPKSLLALLWPLVLLWASQGEQHLLVWYKEDVVVYPSRATDNKSLPLAFQGDSAGSVALLPVQILNDGKRTIGTPDTTWSVRLKAVNAARVAIVGEVRRRPAGLMLRTQPTDDPRTVQLDIGAFESKGAIDLTLMLINVDPRSFPRLELETNLLGLPREIGWGSPADRLFERLATPIFFGLVPILALIRTLELRRNGQLDRLRRPLFLIGQLALLVVFSVIVVWLLKEIGLFGVLLHVI